MKIVNNKDMKKCIFILTIFVLFASGAYADDFYYTDNSGSTDYYTQLNDDTYYSSNTGTSYTVNGDNIYGSNGSTYRQDGDMIYNMQDGSTCYNNNGYIQEF